MLSTMEPVTHIAEAFLISVMVIFGSPQPCSGQIWIGNYLNDLSFILREGDASQGIPKVDPFSLNTNFNIDNEMFSGNVELSGLLSGFSNYFVSNATLNPDLYMDFDLIFLSTSFQGFYKLNASAYKGVFPLSGSGPINVYFSFIEMAANGTLIGKNQMVQLKDFDFQIKQINAVQVGMDGILKDYGLDEVLKPALKGALNTVIKLFKSDLEELINSYVIAHGNTYLRQITLAKILEIIKGLFGDRQSQLKTSNVTSSVYEKHFPKRNLSGVAIRKLWEISPLKNRNLNIKFAHY